MSNRIEYSHIFPSEHIFKVSLINSPIHRGLQLFWRSRESILSVDSIIISNFIRSENQTEAGAHLLANITDPATAFSEEPNTAPMQRLFKSNESYFEIMEKPENVDRFRKFGAGMIGSLKTQSPASVVQSQQISAHAKFGVNNYG